MANSGRPRAGRSLPTAAVVTDENGVVTAWGAEAEQLTGHPASEMVGLPAWEICSRMLPPGRDPDAVRQRVKTMVESVLATGHMPDRPPHPRFQFQTRDGTTRTVEHDVSTVPSGKGVGMVALVRDVGNRGTNAPGKPHDTSIRGQLFQRMTNAVAIGEAVTDESGKAIDFRIIDVNPAYERLTGQRAADVIGKRALETQPHIRPELIERLGLFVAGGEPAQFEENDPATDRSVLIRLSSIGPGLVMAIIEDVTETRRAEAAIRDRNAFIETILASAGEGLIVYDKDLHILMWNPMMEELTDLTADQVLGGKAHHVFPEVMAAGVGDDIEAILAGKPSTAREFEYVIPRTGRRGWVIQTNRPHRTAAGEIVGVVSSVRDVTARHEIDEAIRQSEGQLRTIFDSVGDGIEIHEPGGRFLEVNRVVCERLGYTREELLTMAVEAINTPAAAALIAERAVRILRGDVHVFETTHVRKDGTEIPIEAVARRVEFRGQPAILTVQRDITERKRAEETIREQARFTQELLDAIPIPITAKDPQGRLKMGNEAFARTTGKPLAEIIGKTIPELASFDTRMHALHDRIILETGEPVAYEWDMAIPNHTPRRHLLTKAPLRSHEGTITGVVTAAIDISDRYGVEQELRQSEERFRTLFDSAADPIFMLDPDGQVFVEVNRAACLKLGYSRDEILAMQPHDIDATEYPGGLSAVTAAILERGGRWSETALKRRDGTTIPVDLTATVVELEGRKVILGTARDISDRKRAEAERATLEDQLRQAQKMEGIGRLAGGIAHDFNNLLTAIRGSASLALAELPPGEGPREDLEQIEQAADRAAGLTRQLLAFARRTVLQPEVVDLGAVVRHLEPMLGRLIGEDVTLVTLAPADTGYVLADPGQLEQVIVNLSVNAHDAMPDGGTLTIEVDEIAHAAWKGPEVPGGTLPRTPMVTLRVSDTGVGMEADTLQRIFEPFFTTKGPGKGTGLGLAQVYGIVQASGGTVTVYSEPGHGSTFTVSLPRVEAAPAVRDVPPAIAPGGIRSGTILLVEDDAGVRRFASRVLVAAGYAVMTAPDGVSAIDMARGVTVQLLLTDVVMPGLSGREVAARLSAAQPGIRILYMSGHTEKGIVHDGILEAGIHFLAKPFTSEALLAAADAAMAQQVVE